MIVFKTTTLITAILWADQGGTAQVRGRPVLGEPAMGDVHPVLGAVAGHARRSHHHHRQGTQVRCS